MPRIIFSCPVPLGQQVGGPFTVLNYLRSGLEKFYSNNLTIISGEGFPYEAARSLAAGSLFDELASFEDLSCDLFLGVGYDSLLQIREVKQNGGKVLTIHMSTQHNHAYQVLKQEYELWRKLGEPLPPLLRWRGTREHELVDGIIVPSEQCKETYEKNPRLKGRVHVANFGVDSSLFHPAEKPVDGFKVLFAGGNFVRKGLGYLIHAWMNLRPKGALTIMGTLLEGAPPEIHQLGWIADERVPEIYREHTVYCLPSLEEGQALTVIEAMASGLPCIITRETGAPIEDGKDGLIVPPRDPKKLQDALQYLYDNPDEIKRMGQNARAKAETLTWERFQDRILEIVEECLV